MKNYFLIILLASFVIACENVEKSQFATKTLGYFPYEDFFNARNFQETTFDHKLYFKRIEEEKRNYLTRPPNGV